MKYTSTRSSSISCSFEDAIFAGYAPDGGLFVPERLVPLSKELLQEWSALDYPSLSYQLLRLYIAREEIGDEELRELCCKALDGFEDPSNAVPVRKFDGLNLHVAELFHGPTFCFKDLGMRILIYLLSHFCTKRNRKTTLLVSTTGDTGPAAVQAVSDVNNPLLTILVHYPEGQISDFQRKQLTTVQSRYVKIATFQGGGDDMDRPIKNMLAQENNDMGILLTGVNSYNIGRPLMQSVHFIWTYLRVAEALSTDVGDLVLDMILPTGAMGNIAGGYMAKKMGLPIGKLNAGVNINDIIDRVIHTGAFHKSEIMHKTLSEAINVQVPYNFERLLFYLTDQNHTLVNDWMMMVDQTQKMDLDRDWLAKLQQDFDSAQVTDKELCETVRQVLAKHKYWIDPHTAVAWCAAEKLGYCTKDNKCLALLSTASPCKFQEALESAVGKEGWKAYESESFPLAAKQILDRPEVAPTLYHAREALSLEENQCEWEKLAWQLVRDFI